ncbi:MAG TPA: hypothetical protein VF771_11120 [Longimicrobiaceae bacterium]
MATKAKDTEIPRVEWDPEEERELREKLIAAGFRMPTKSLDRPRVAVKGRPRWLAFLVRLFRLQG